MLSREQPEGWPRTICHSPQAQTWSNEGRGKGEPREEQDLLFLVSQLDPSLWGMRCCHRQVFLRTVLLVHPQR